MGNLPGVLVSGPPGRLIAGVPVQEKIRGKMNYRDHTNDVGTDAQTWLGHAPKVSDALKKGVVVSIATWGGRDLTGTICDWEQTGLLLDVSDPEDGSDGYVFIPWSSIERVNIGAVTPRRVKVLHS
jgi:hypothetical protein